MMRPKSAFCSGSTSVRQSRRHCWTRAAVKGYGGIAALKHLLGRRGFACHGTRLPFQDLDSAARAELDRVMDRSGDLG